MQLSRKAFAVGCLMHYAINMLNAVLATRLAGGLNCCGVSETLCSTKNEVFLDFPKRYAVI